VAESITDKLATMHKLVVDSILDDLEGLEQPMADGDGNSVAWPMEQRQAIQRMALAVLKQNGVTAPAPKGSGLNNAAKLAGKLDFKGLQEKRAIVLPFKREPESPAA
jgi:hypothetical protein